jgi:hypothetical protein
VIDLRKKIDGKKCERVIDRKKINLCKKGLMSVCTAKDNKEQEECDFYDKSSVGNKCMCFIFNEYCDCLAAQMKSKGE